MNNTGKLSYIVAPNTANATVKNHSKPCTITGYSSYYILNQTFINWCSIAIIN